MQHFSLNEKQTQALQRIINGESLFISGPGGVGKSVLIREIKRLYDGTTVFIAPTGIAALNIDGATIHSTFKLPLQILDKEAIRRDPNQKVKELFSRSGPVERIVIDEISMVRADLLAAIDMQLRKARRLNQPFGGLQVIVVGDFYQLPPVLVNKEQRTFFDNYDSVYCFSTESWAAVNFEYIELDQIMRQTDVEFIGHLQNIRTKADGYLDSIKYMNEKAISNADAVLEEDPVYLTATNKAADTYNAVNFEDLDGDIDTYRARVTGVFDQYPAPKYLDIKYGTKVIMTANGEGYVNGSVGYVCGKLGSMLKVALEPNGEVVFVDRHKWEQKEYGVGSNGGLKVEVIGTFEQYPMKHGWASTIHKAQGQTLPYGVIDLGRGAFCHGQTYVALSRLKTIEGMGIVSPIQRSDVIVDPQVNEFYKNGCKGIGLF